MEENQETIADIIAEMRGFERYAASDSNDCRYVAYWLYQTFPDRLEAARKREVNKLNSAIQATVGRSDAEIDRLRREIAELKRAGNAAKLREALIKARSAICHFARHQCHSLSWENSNIQANCGDMLCSWRGLCDAKTTINAALYAPPRTCDKYSADELKDIFNSELSSKLPMANKNEKKLVAITAMGMIDILLAPSTEKEGGAK